MSHGWTYQALVSDCLEMKLNRVTVTQPQKKAFDLDSKDFFWAKNAASPFPQVAEDIDAELNRYKQHGLISTSALDHHFSVLSTRST